MPPQGTFTRMEAPWPKKSTGRPIGEIRAVHRPATGSVATQGTTGATFRGHRSDHRTPQAVAQDSTGRSTGRPQDPTGRGTGRPQDTTGGHRTGHRAAQEPPQGRHRQSQAGPHDTTGSPTGDTKGQPRGQATGPLPARHGGRSHTAGWPHGPLLVHHSSPPIGVFQSVWEADDQCLTSREGGCALPCGHGRAPSAQRHYLKASRGPEKCYATGDLGENWGSGVHALGGLLGAGWGWCWWESLDFSLF